MMNDLIFSKLISTVTLKNQEEEEKDEQRREILRKKRSERRKRNGIHSSSCHSFHSLWICVAMLLLNMMKSCEAFDKLPNGNGCFDSCSASWCSKCTGSSSLGGVVAEWIKGGTERAEVVAKYGEIEIWDTSDVLSLREVFRDKSTFNEDISKWDVSSVTDMRESTSLSFSLFSFCSCIHKHILNYNIFRTPNIYTNLFPF